MTVCRDVPANLDRNWDNLNEMYVALGVRHSGEGGPALGPPSTYTDSQSLSYMVGPSGMPKRSINIALFNDPDARACFFRWAGYDETTVNARITAIRGEHPDDQAAADEAVQTYLNTLPPLQQQIYRTVGMINVFRQDYRLENGVNVGGANRGTPDAAEPANADIITDFEIQQYAAEALEGGDQNPAYGATGGRILTGIHSLIGLMQYVTTPEPDSVTTAPVTLSPDAGPVSVPADAAVTSVPDASLPADAAVSTAPDAAPADAAVISVPDAEPTAPVETSALFDAGLSGNVSTRRRRHEHDGWNIPAFLKEWAPRALLVGVGVLFGYLWRGRGSGSGPAPTTPRPNPGPAPAAPAAASRISPPAAPSVTEGDELNAALAELGSPAPADPPPLPSRLQYGPTAEPSTGVDASVVRTQIVLRCRFVMSLAARNALLNNQPLPEGTALVDSHFAPQVETMTNEVMRAYNRWQTTNPTAIREQWLRERASGLPRDGVPDRMLTEVLGPRLLEMGRAVAMTDAPTTVLRMEEARDHFANRENMEHAFREILRHGR